MVPSIAAGLGLSGFDNALNCPSVQHAVVCLLDGLGATALREHEHDAPMLSSGARSEIESVFPTTTPTALASLGVGVLPGTHGLVGASFMLPETGTVLSPLSWGHEPSPVSVQPEPTMFEVLARAGVQVCTVSASSYADSGLTRAVLRGGRYLPADTLQERVGALLTATAGTQRTFTYVYLPTIDRVGHEFGVGSSQWRRSLHEADAVVASLFEVLPPNTTMFVTADHGMVNCPATGRVSIDETPDLCADVDIVAGEPRARHLYVRPGAASDVARRWRDRLGERARVLRRDELIEEGLLGAVEDFAAERIGDVVCIALGDTSLASSTDQRVSSLLGQHGAMTIDEWRVPGIWFDSGVDGSRSRG